MIDQILEVDWSPKIGDPTTLGWATTAGYLLAAALSLICALRARVDSDGQPVLQQSMLWLLLSCGLGLLGINKQLDLQTWLIAVARNVALQQGWYARRDSVQVWFVAWVILISLIILFGSMMRFRRHGRQYMFELFGLLFILRFLIVRTASILGVSLPRLSRFTGGVALNWVLEFVGISIILLAISYRLLFHPHRTAG